MRIDIDKDKHGCILIKTLDPVGYTVGGKSIIIPPGYVSDGFSCPRFIQCIISPQCDPRTLHAGLAHDHIYQYHIVSRSEADAFLRDDLIRHNFGVILSWIVWLGVRIFGRLFW